MSRAVKFSMAPGSPYFASAAQLVQTYLVICSMSLMWDDTSHSACRLHKELTVETITVLTVKFTPKLVFKTEWNDLVDQSLHTRSLMWSLILFFMFFVYSYSTTNLATSHINTHQQVLLISFQTTLVFPHAWPLSTSQALPPSHLEQPQTNILAIKHKLNVF